MKIHIIHRDKRDLIIDILETKLHYDQLKGKSRYFPDCLKYLMVGIASTLKDGGTIHIRDKEQTNVLP